MRTWYLQRAVPWAALLGGLLAGALLVGLSHRWETFTWLGQPLTALLACAAAALVLDEPALAATSVSPRARWATTSRLATAVLPLAGGLLLLLAMPGSQQAAEWALVLTGLGVLLLALALGASRRLVTRPGAGLGSAAVLVGMAPLVLGLFFDLRSPYPPLSDVQVASWATAGLAGAIGCAVLLSRPLRLSRTRRHPARDVPGVPGTSSRHVGTTVSGDPVAGTATVVRAATEPGARR